MRLQKPPLERRPLSRLLRRLQSLAQCGKEAIDQSRPLRSLTLHQCLSADALRHAQRRPLLPLPSEEANELIVSLLNSSPRPPLLLSDRAASGGLGGGHHFLDDGNQSAILRRAHPSGEQEGADEIGKAAVLDAAGAAGIGSGERGRDVVLGEAVAERRLLRLAAVKS